MQHCEEVLQAVIGVTGDETDWRESRDPGQLLVQVPSLTLRQQVGFIQHQENSARRKDCRNESRTVGKGSFLNRTVLMCSSYRVQAALGGRGRSSGGAGRILQPLGR